MTSILDSSTSVRVRKLDQWVVHAHTKLAENEGLSLEGYLRKLLKEQALVARHKMADELEEMQAELISKYPEGHFPNSVDLIRSIRDESET